MGLGAAVRRYANGIAGKPLGPGPGQSGQFGFDPISNFSHDFLKPFSITFDYHRMDLYIAGESLPR